MALATKDLFMVLHFEAAGTSKPLASKACLNRLLKSSKLKQMPRPLSRHQPIVALYSELERKEYNVHSDYLWIVKEHL